MFSLENYLNLSTNKTEGRHDYDYDNEYNDGQKNINMTNPLNSSKLTVYGTNTYFTYIREYGDYQNNIITWRNFIRSVRTLHYLNTDFLPKVGKFIATRESLHDNSRLPTSDNKWRRHIQWHVIRCMDKASYK